MKLRDILLRKKVKISVIIMLGLAFTYLIFHIFVSPADPVLPFLSYVDNSYLLLAEKFANLLLHWTGSPVSIEGHAIIINNTPIGAIQTVTILKKWGVLLLLIFWFTKTSFKNKAYFTIILLVVNFLLLSIEVAVEPITPSPDYENHTIIAILRTIGVLSMTTLLFIWYWKNKKSILRGLSKLKINTELLENKFPTIIILTYLYAIIGIFLLQYFDYHGWINFLFEASRKILLVMGHQATVEPSLLIGDNGSIYMAKGCLGIKTMLLFASVVYLTGNDNKSRWIYIISGIIFLNFVNIMRFVFLFIHIQNHGGYVLSMDLHDMYNYITYSIVFILWIIWFEKFTNINREIFRKNN